MHVVILFGVFLVRDLPLVYFFLCRIHVKIKFLRQDAWIQYLILELFFTLLC
jgi:hypothetical protein